MVFVHFTDGSRGCRMKTINQDDEQQPALILTCEGPCSIKTIT